MILNTTQSGLSDGPYLLLVHGLFGSASNLGAIAKGLQDHFRIVSVDVRNHGSSPWGQAMNYGALADDLLETMDHLGIRQACLIGHSMGGKIVMATALKASARVQCLVVADIAPVIYKHDLLDYVQAMLRVDLQAVKSRGEADSHLARAIPEAPIRQFLLQNLVRSKDNVLGWRLNLEALRDGMTDLTGWDMAAPATPLSLPVAALYGTASPYVGDKHLPAFNAYFSKVTPLPITGAGHWLHAEKPKEVIAAIRGYLTL